MPIYSPDSGPDSGRGIAPTPTARIRRACLAGPGNRHNGSCCRHVNPQRAPDYATYASRLRIAGKESPRNRRSASSSRLRPGARWFPVDFGFSGAAHVGARVCVIEEAQETNNPSSSFWSGGLAFTAELTSRSSWLGTGVQGGRDQRCGAPITPARRTSRIYLSSFLRLLAESLGPVARDENAASSASPARHRRREEWTP
jgi:hypothetical protein